MPTEPTSAALGHLLGTLDELLWEEDPEVDLELGRASLHAETLELELAVSYESEPHSLWRITCIGTVENRVTLGEVWWLEVDPTHVLLLDHMDSQAGLYFTGAALDPALIVDRMRQAHDDVVGVWRPMTRYVNQLGGLEQLLSSPSGLIASGPVTLLARYQAALESCGVEAHIIDRRRPVHWAKRRELEARPPFRALILQHDEPRRDATAEYVIAESFAVERLDV